MFEIINRRFDIEKNGKQHTVSYAALAHSVVVSMDVYIQKYGQKKSHSRKLAAEKIKEIADKLNQITLSNEAIKKALLLFQLYVEFSRINFEGSFFSELSWLIISTLGIELLNFTDSQAYDFFYDYEFNLSDPCNKAFMSRLRSSFDFSLTEADQVVLSSLVNDVYKRFWKDELERICSSSENPFVSQKNALIAYIDSESFNSEEFMEKLHAEILAQEITTCADVSRAQIEKWVTTLLMIQNDLIQLVPMHDIPVEMIQRLAPNVVLQKNVEVKNAVTQQGLKYVRDLCVKSEIDELMLDVATRFVYCVMALRCNEKPEAAKYIINLMNDSCDLNLSQQRIDYIIKITEKNTRPISKEEKNKTNNELFINAAKTISTTLLKIERLKGGACFSEVMKPFITDNAYVALMWMNNTLKLNISPEIIKKWVIDAIKDDIEKINLEHPSNNQKKLMPEEKLLTPNVVSTENIEEQLVLPTREFTLENEALFDAMRESEIDSPPPQYSSVAFFKPSIVVLTVPVAEQGSSKDDDWMDELFGISKKQPNANDLLQLRVPTTELPDGTVKSMLKIP